MQAVAGERLISVFGELEIVNAFRLRVFRSEISDVQARKSLTDFQSDLSEGVLQLRGMNDASLDRALALSNQTTSKLGTRTADLLHVAIAIELGAECIYSFDLQQRKLAHFLHLKLN